MKLTFLGTGTSHGVPVIACDCQVCKSNDPRDKRYRSSAYVQYQTKNGESKYILIDIGPDFRSQALRQDIRQIDTVLLTHSHADHLHGIDDLRIFSCIMSNKPENPENEKYNRPPIPFYTNKGTAQDIRHRFGYIFSEQAEGGGHAKIDLQTASRSFMVDNIKITPIPMLHGHLETTGWLLTEEVVEDSNSSQSQTQTRPAKKKSIAYLTDCSYISEESIKLIKDESGLTDGSGSLVHLVIDGLRIKEHSTHFNFLQALETSSKIGGQHIWFTHLTHNSSHTQVTEYLAEHRAEFPGLEKAESILPAYDQLTIEI